MIDPIELAGKISDAKKLNKNVNDVKGLIKSSTERLPSAQPYVGKLPPTLKKLPTVKDPRLQRRQAEAEAQKVQTEVQRRLMEGKEGLVEETKEKISQFKSLIPRLPSIPKLPISDAKVLAELQFAKLKARVLAEKQKLSKKNLKKSKELFKFPMGKRPFADKGIKIPEIPKVKLPVLPPVNLPEVPQVKLPNINNIP